jgi:chromosome partitioning protein
VFDRESAGDCYAELMTLPRIATGRCKVAAVGMRVDARTKAAETLQAWAEQHKIPFIGVLRDTQAYVRCVERGLTLFDLPASHVRADMAQWQAILDWLDPVLHPPVNAPEPVKRSVRPCYVPPSAAFNGLASAAPIRVSQPEPALETGAYASVRTVPRAEPIAHTIARPTFASRLGRLFDLFPTGRALPQRSS